MADGAAFGSMCEARLADFTYTWDVESKVLSMAFCAQSFRVRFTGEGISHRNLNASTSGSTSSHGESSERESEDR